MDFLTWRQNHRLVEHIFFISRCVFQIPSNQKNQIFTRLKATVLSVAYVIVNSPISFSIS